MAAVVVLGIFLVGFSRNQEQGKGQLATKVPPRINTGTGTDDHWHAALSVYLCDHFAPNIALFESADGIHTHGDGVIHVHPYTAKAAGNNATLGFFVRAVPGNFKLSSTELQYPKDKTDWKNGDKCQGKPGKVKLTVNGKQLNIDPTTYKIRNGDLIDVGFVPDATPLPSNPAEKKNLANITDVSPPTGTTTPGAPAPSGSTPAPGSARVTPSSVAPASTSGPDLPSLGPGRRCPDLGACGHLRAGGHLRACGQRPSHVDAVRAVILVGGEGTRLRT